MKIGIAHSCMSFGGSEARAVWAIQALRDHHDLTLITPRRVNVDDLNRFYGTSLKSADFRQRIAPAPLGFRPALDAAALRGAIFQRFCRSIAGEFDVLISAYNLCDFGVPAIQCIADFSWDMTLRYRPQLGSELIHRDNVLRSAYLTVCGMIRRPSGRNLLGGQDLIVANSHWTAEQLQRRHGAADCVVIYPPVNFPQVDVPWSQRETGFVCLGRISPEKRIERIIQILSGVREIGHNVHLHVIGRFDGSSYSRMIRQLCRENGGWVRIEGEQIGQSKVRLLSSHRYGIHACNIEAFGIAVAEMTKAGCIAFVPDQGGQVEIVNHPMLCYCDIDDAVRKIDVVLRSEELQTSLRQYLQKQAAMFSAEEFMRDFRGVVDCFLHQRQEVRQSA